MGQARDEDEEEEDRTVQSSADPIQTHDKCCAIKKEGHTGNTDNLRVLILVRSR